MLAGIAALLAVSPLLVQSPTGVIAGVVTDESGAPLSGASITIVHVDTSQRRAASTAADGSYVVPGLAPGAYRIAVELTRFKRSERPSTVEAGTTTTANVALELGAIQETVTVAAAQPLLHYDHHQVAGVVTRSQIENLPLNGRNFFELAKLEPGVTNPTRGAFNRTFVAVLGSGLSSIPRVGYTRATVDGANIGSVAAIGTGLQVSQEAVQEFQMATAGFDLAMGATTNGAINVVTRSGGATFGGGGFYFYRDHQLAAYPGLTIDPRNPDPFFRRQQFGAAAGGPLGSDRRFFFASYERTAQHGITSVRPTLSVFDAFGGLFPTPADGDLLTGRVDLRVTSRQHALVRYTFDANETFSGTVLPSAWTRVVGRSSQVLGTLTSVWPVNVVNELRVSFFAPGATQSPASSDDCAGCFGVDHPRLVVADSGVTVGRAPRQEFVTRRFELGDAVHLQRGRHNVRTGFSFEHGSSRASLSGALTITLWSPDQVQKADPTIPVPASFNTIDDFLKLPFKALDTVIGPETIPERGFRQTRLLDLYRVYAADTWRLHPRVTINGGVAWSYEPNALNHDLSKPAWLAPLLGASGLGPPLPQRGNVTPAGGFSWILGRGGRTIVRGGAGRYFDPAMSSNGTNLGNERLFLSPLGAGRVPVTGAQIIVDGQTLAGNERQVSSFTGAQLLTVLPGQLAQLAASYNPANRDFSVRTIDLLKTATNLYDPAYATPSAVHASIGLQREMRAGFVIGLDLLWKRFSHTYLNGIDYNRYNSAAPVIAKCTTAQRNDVDAVCSNGPIYFDTTFGRDRYRGLLVRAERRLSGGWQLLVSYAYASYVGTNGTGLGTAEMTGGRVFGFNNNDWNENYGPLPTDLRHVLNVSGLARLPRQLQLAFSVSAYSRPPFSAYVGSRDFNGDGTTNDLLPGSRINQFGRGFDKADLVRLVQEYNARFPASPLTLPASYSFDDTFFTQDVRLGRSFGVRASRARLSLMIEVFNLFNTANLAGYSGNLNSAAFGQPTAQFTQFFGSGGPRAAQVGARLSF